MKSTIQLIAIFISLLGQPASSDVILTDKPGIDGRLLEEWRESNLDSFLSYVTDFNLHLDGRLLGRLWMRIDPTTSKVTVRRNLIECQFGHLKADSAGIRFEWQDGTVEQISIFTNGRRFVIIPLDPKTRKQRDLIQISKLRDFSHELPCEGLLS